MENSTESGKNRAELIKRARENCIRNLDLPYRQQKDTKNVSVSGVSVKRKLFMIRSVCAILLLLLVIAFDQFDIHYYGIHSESIEEVVSSNQPMDQIEKIERKLADFAEEKIIPVFNRLK